LSATPSATGEESPMKVVPADQVVVDVRFTPRGSDLLPRKREVRPQHASAGGLPLRGDFVTITVGNHQLTFRVVSRNFELLSGITTIRDRARRSR
jgi:hypothetical protein